MPSLFKGFCYATQVEAANADIASGSFSASAGLVSPQSYTVINATTVQMLYVYKPLTTTAQANYIHTRTYPLCTSVGQIDNNSGVSVSDAVFVSWLVVIVWAAAYYFKTLRTGVRGY